MKKFIRIFYSTLLGGSMVVLISLFASAFSIEFYQRLEDGGLMYVTYLYVFFLPFLFILFYILSLILELVRRADSKSKIPLFIVPFIFFSTIFILFSLNESYITEIETYLLFFSVSLILALCSVPIVKYYPRAQEKDED